MPNGSVTMPPMDDGPQDFAELAGYAGRVAQQASDQAEAKLQREVARLRHESLRWLAAQSRELVTLAGCAHGPRVDARRSLITRGRPAQRH